MFYAIGTNIGDRIGFPQFAIEVPKLEAEGFWWGRLGVALPFLAALLLGFGKDEVDKDLGRVELTQRKVITYTTEMPKWFAPIVSYLVRLAVSVLGSLGFMVLLLLVLFAFYKLGIHTS